jgi:Ca-activated chloride channel family protein
MSIQAWFRLARVRRGLAVSAVVLSTGGLVLARTPVGAGVPGTPDAHVALAGGSNAVTFAGTGVHGRLALSHTRVLAGGSQHVFAELDLRADPAEHQVARAPLAIAVALDTSGSMGGEKIEHAKESVIRLIRDMRDDDEIAMVRFSSRSEMIQPLAPVGRVRSSLIARVEALEAGGGTNIPSALSQALATLADAGKGRVRRVVLASDGLDDGRASSELQARQSAERGTTVSSMGIGLDFDAAYMGGVAQAGHGNFAFVEDASALAGFLHRELEETAATTAEAVTAHLRLPEGLRFVRAIGGDGSGIGAGGEVEIRLGSLFAGDERRVVVELEARILAGETRAIEGSVGWNVVGGDTATARFAGLTLTGSSDPLAVEEGRDGAVLANATSVMASIRQLEAADAYERGDTARAQALIEQNKRELAVAAAAAPPAAAPALTAQAAAYDHTAMKFRAAAPSSEAGRSAARAGAMKDFSNMGRNAAF